MSKKFEKCEDCHGSGHLWIPQGKSYPLVSHCPACKGRGRVEVENPQDDELENSRREMGKTFHTGGNT